MDQIVLYYSHNGSQPASGDLSQPALPPHAMLGPWRLSGPFRAGSHQPCWLSYGDNAWPLQCCSNETAGDLLKHSPSCLFFSAHLPTPSVPRQKGSYLSIPNPETHTQHLRGLQSPCPASAGIQSRHTQTLAFTQRYKHTNTILFGPYLLRCVVSFLWVTK